MLSPPETEKPLIAVIPFDNLSNDPDQAFFSDGITQDIMTELSRFEDLVIVISPSASFRPQGDVASIQEVTGGLRAQYLVEGSVRQARNRVRVSVRLTERASGSQIWSDRFDRDLEDVFEIQDEIARKIATMVSGKIFINSYDLANRRLPTDLTAYQHVLRGEWLNLHDWGHPAALENFEIAVEADPSCARAYANLAQWHGNRVFQTNPCFDDIVEKVHENASKALELDPGNILNLCYVAIGYLDIGEHQISRTLMDKVTSTNPNFVMAMIYAAESYGWSGDLDKSMHWLEKYWQVLPKSYGADVFSSSQLYFMAERYEKAVKEMSTLHNLDHEHAFLLALCHAQLGQMEVAEEMRLRFEDLKPEGFEFADYERAILRTCARKKERDLWREGFRKAGFL